MKNRVIGKIKALRYYGQEESWELIETQHGEIYIAHGGDLYHPDSFLGLVHDLQRLAKKLIKATGGEVKK